MKLDSFHAMLVPLASVFSQPSFENLAMGPERRIRKGLVGGILLSPLDINGV
jgi:hypothetical protein